MTDAITKLTAGMKTITRKEFESIKQANILDKNDEPIFIMKEDDGELILKLDETQYNLLKKRFKDRKTQSITLDEKNNLKFGNTTTQIDIKQFSAIKTATNPLSSAAAQHTVNEINAVIDAAKNKGVFSKDTFIKTIKAIMPDVKDAQIQTVWQHLDSGTLGLQESLMTIGMAGSQVTEVTSIIFGLLNAGGEAITPDKLELKQNERLKNQGRNLINLFTAIPRLFNAGTKALAGGSDVASSYLGWEDTINELLLRVDKQTITNLQERINILKKDSPYHQYAEVVLADSRTGLNNNHRFKNGVKDALAIRLAELKEASGLDQNTANDILSRYENATKDTQITEQDPQQKAFAEKVVKTITGFAKTVNDLPHDLLAEITKLEKLPESSKLTDNDKDTVITMAVYSMLLQAEKTQKLTSDQRETGLRNLENAGREAQTAIQDITGFAANVTDNLNLGWEPFNKTKDATLGVVTGTVKTLGEVATLDFEKAKKSGLKVVDNLLFGSTSLSKNKQEQINEIIEKMKGLDRNNPEYTELKSKKEALESALNTLKVNADNAKKAYDNGLAQINQENNINATSVSDVAEALRQAEQDLANAEIEKEKYIEKMENGGDAAAKARKELALMKGRLERLEAEKARLEDLGEKAQEAAYKEKNKNKAWYEINDEVEMPDEEKKAIEDKQKEIDNLETELKNKEEEIAKAEKNAKDSTWGWLGFKKDVDTKTQDDAIEAAKAKVAKLKEALETIENLHEKYVDAKDDLNDEKLLPGKTTKASSYVITDAEFKEIKFSKPKLNAEANEPIQQGDLKYKNGKTIATVKIYNDREVQEYTDKTVTIYPYGKVVEVNKITGEEKVYENKKARAAYETQRNINNAIPDGKLIETLRKVIPSDQKEYLAQLETAINRDPSIKKEILIQLILLQGLQSGKFDAQYIQTHGERIRQIAENDESAFWNWVHETTTGEFSTNTYNNSANAGELSVGEHALNMLGGALFGTVRQIIRNPITSADLAALATLCPRTAGSVMAIALGTYEVATGAYDIYNSTDKWKTRKGDSKMGSGALKIATGTVSLSMFHCDGSIIDHCCWGGHGRSWVVRILNNNNNNHGNFLGNNGSPSVDLAD